MRAVGRHAPFAVILAGGFVLRVLATLAYRPALLLQRDAYVYLEMASGVANAYRPPLYPFLLKPAVAWGNLTVVTICQHALGLAIGIATYLLLRRLGAGRWAGALGTAPILLDAYQVDIEHYVLAETLFQSLLMGSMLLLAWWARPSNAAIALAGLLLALCGITRFVGVAVIVAALVYVLWARMGWLRLVSLATGFALTLGFYTIVSQREDDQPAVRSGFFLYGRVASFADCHDVQVSPDLRRFCLDEADKEDLKGGFFTLGLPLRELRADPDANAKLLEFSRRMIVGKPLAYAGAVLEDLWRYVEPVEPPAKESFVARWLFVSSVDEAEPHPYVAARGGAPPSELGITQTFRIDRRIAPWLRGYQRVAYLWGPLIGMCLLLGAVGALAGVHRIGDRDVRPVCGLFVLAALSLLVGAVMTTVYHFRYVIAPLPLFGPAGALGASLLWRRFTATAGNDVSAGEDVSGKSGEHAKLKRRQSEGEQA
jgi:hypothetical protein